jgi:hypothetical protein
MGFIFLGEYPRPLAFVIMPVLTSPRTNSQIFLIIYLNPIFEGSTVVLF